MKFIQSLTALILLFSLLPAQESDRRSVSSLEIVQKGDYRVTEALIRNNITTGPGSIYQPLLLDEDIKNLIEKNVVSSAEFLAKPDGEKVALRLVVNPLPQLAGVGFVGNNDFSNYKLLRQTDLKAGDPVSESVIFNAIKKLKKFYRDNGYSKFNISHKVQKSSRNGFVDLVFTLNESRKNLVADIKFEGNSAFTGKGLRAQMKTRESGFFSWLTKSNRIEKNQLEEDIESVVEFYRENGYLKAKSNGYYWKNQKNKSDLYIKVYEGAKYEISGVSIDSNEIYSDKELFPALSLRSGSAFSSKKLREDKNRIRRYYGVKGYADVRVIEQLKDAGRNKINIHYRIIPGKSVKVGYVNIEGNTKTKDKVIRRELTLRPEAPLNRVALENTQNRLRNTGYFSEVYVSDRATRDGKRDIDIQVKEKATGSIGVGAGFSSDSALVGFFNISQSNFDIFNPWGFQGGGQRFGMSINYGESRKDFKLNLVEPWFMGYQLREINELYYTEKNFVSDFYEQRDAGGSVALRFPLTKRTYLQAGVRLENIRVDGFDLGQPAALGTFFDDYTTQSEDLTYFRTALELGFSFDSRDRIQTPRKGTQFDLGLKLSGLFGGDVQNYQFNLDYKKHIRMRWDSILNIDVSVGVSEEAFGGDEVQHFDRQFLGGFRNLRGFDFREASPLVPGLASPEPIGGNTSLATTFEVTFPLVENIRLALFADAGFVNEDSWDFESSHILGDAGVGFRLNLPVGPIAIDFIPYHFFSNSDDEAIYDDSLKSFQFYFNTEF